eukprot:g15983.t1
MSVLPRASPTSPTSPTSLVQIARTTSKSGCLEPFLAQVAAVVQEYDRLLAENERLREGDWRVQDGPVDDEILKDHKSFAAESGKKSVHMQQAVFRDPADMKQAVRAELMKDKGYDVKNFYKERGIFQWLARHPWFENVTICIIGIYAVWMAIDTDFNKAAACRQYLPQSVLSFMFCGHVRCISA